MDHETARYILSYFSRFLTDDERMAIKHTNSIYKLQNSSSDNTQLTRVYREKGWITSNQKVLDLLKDGYDNFELNAATRILTHGPGGVFFNRCPKCKKLARTPFARQCRHCRHNWHDLVVAKFKLCSTFQLPNRHFFLLGKIAKGNIQSGNFMDLTLLGLNKRPKIKTIEFILKRDKGNVWEDTALGTDALSEEDKDYLGKFSAFEISIDITKDRPN